MYEKEAGESRVENFNYQSLRHAIEPVVFPYIRWQPSMIAVRLKPGDISGGIESVKKIWNEFAPNRPFEFSFLDQDFNRLYQSEEQMSEMFLILSMLAIFIASLGLFGLASYAVQQRTKEIGVRKVLGASVGGIAVLLSRDVLSLVIITGTLAIPAVDYFMNRWLRLFAYRVNIGAWVFLLSISIALIIAALSIGYRTIKAATANPVESLRYE